MKDANDTKTKELFPETKKRGRPSTGAALTAAQRQAKYRSSKKKVGDDDLGHKNLNIWIPTAAMLALRRLARHRGQTPAQVLEILAITEESRVVALWDELSEAREAYYDFFD